MYENAASYLGQYNIGTNSSDKGQCVGLYNQVVLNVSGILYPIQGAQGAKDLLTAKNTRPDLFQQIFDKPGDPNWIPKKGDWVVWGSTWGGGWGHVACVKTADANSFTSVEQNFVPNKVTEQWHDYQGVIGWIRYTPPAPTDPCADVKAQLNAANQQVTSLTNQVNSLNLQLTQKQAELDQANAQIKNLSDANTALQAQVSERDATIAQLNSQITNLNAEIAQLKKQLEHCGGITINFNFIGSILWFIIQKVGKK